MRPAIRYGAIKSAHYTDRLQSLVPDGVAARAVYSNFGKVIGLGLARGRNVAAVHVLRRLLERDPDRQLRIAAEFLLYRLDHVEAPYPGEG